MVVRTRAISEGNLESFGNAANIMRLDDDILKKQVELYVRNWEIHEEMQKDYCNDPEKYDPALLEITKEMLQINQNAEMGRRLLEKSIPTEFPEEIRAAFNW